MRGEPLGHFLLEHQRKAAIGRDPRQPAQEERRRDVIGKIGDDLARRRRQSRRIEGQRIAFDKGEPPGKGSGQLGERRQAAVVALDRDDMRGAFEQQGAGEAAGAGPNLDDCDTVERTRRPRDPPRQVEIEEKILPECPMRRQAVAADHLAEGRQRGLRLDHRRSQPAALAPRRRSAIAPARSRAAMRLAGLAVPRPAMSQAVP